MREEENIVREGANGTESQKEIPLSSCRCHTPWSRFCSVNFDSLVRADGNQALSLSATLSETTPNNIAVKRQVLCPGPLRQNISSRNVSSSRYQL